MDYVFLDIIRLNLCEKIKIINGGIVKMKKTKGITLIATHCNHSNNANFSRCNN